jgi:class 3 adenylate cyclase
LHTNAPARHRNDHPAPSVARYGGRVVNLGDGALVEFASAVNALSAATECPLNRRLPSSRPQISDGKPD